MRSLFRKKDKKREEPTSPLPPELRPNVALDSLRCPPTQFSARLLAALPEKVLHRIFTFVCPHALDQSYDTCESSPIGRGCMLCDLRDLAHCGQVNHAWRPIVNKILYHSVRIDPVHYCSREAFLAERRKKTSRFNKNGIPEDPALARLRLLRRTVREDPTRLGKTVQFLKIPYQIRESYHSELAQTIAVLPNLKYVDLPEGMFSDDPTFATLRLEVQARCPNIRKATYLGGSERSFATLADGQIWPQLEVLELNSLNVEPRMLRAVLSCLPNLRALKVSETYSLSDEVLVADEYLPPLPALEELILKDTPSLTAAGIVDYLSFFEMQQSLKVLTLKDTGIKPWMLQDVLSMAPSLKTLAIQSKVAEPFPSHEAVQPLAHKRLRTLRFEISAKSSAGPFATQGYYSYLANSVLAGGLPRLRRLYVFDEKFPDQLQNLPPPTATFAGGRVRSSSNSSGHMGAPALRVSPPGSASPLASPTRQGFGNVLSPSRQNFGNVASPTRQNFSNAANPNRFSSNNPFAHAPGRSPAMQTLEVFTKSDEFGQWNFARVDSFTAAATAPSGRPSSSYGLAADVTGQGWDRGEARRSVMIGNGAGGFSPVPGTDAERDPGGFTLGAVPMRNKADMLRPLSSAGDARRSRGFGR